MNEIYIDAGLFETRVAVVDDGELAEIHIERRGGERTAGNIYKGVVENVLPGMQAAFVNIGFEKNAFLYVKDAVDYKAYGYNGTESDVLINKVLKQGDEVMVQVAKEPTGSKGARVTTHITLPGRFMVLMPGVDYIGVSRRIENPDERERLKAMAAEIKPEGIGLIVRTEAEGKSRHDFVDDINFLLKLWEKIKYEGERGKSPRLIHKDADLVYRSIRDLFNRDTVKVMVNDMDTYKKVRDLISLFSPSQLNILEYYENGPNMFGNLGIEKEIEKALSRTVWLKSGGYIVIDQTEALTSIDVNSGRYTGSYSLRDTVLNINMEAAREIARQLRIRDIGGIVIIDFIDMDKDEHKEKVLEELKNRLKKDRTKSSVLGITQLGLVEMTRKKVGKRLDFIMQKQCPRCEGSGRITDEKTVVMAIGRKLESVFRETDVHSVLVELNEAVRDYIIENDYGFIKGLQKEYDRKIYIRGVPSMEYSDFRVKYLTKSHEEPDLTKPLTIGSSVEINGINIGNLDTSSRTVRLGGRVDKIISDDSGHIEKVIISFADDGGIH